MRRNWASLLATAALLLGGCADDDGGPGPLGLGGNSGSGSGGANSSATVSATNGPATSTVAATTGAGADCDPPAEPGTFYDTSDTALNGQPTRMCAYRGEVVLAFNAAAL